MDSGLGYPVKRKSALYAHHDLPLPSVDAPDPEALMVSCLTFLNAIEINPAKSELMVVTPTSNIYEHNVSLAGSVVSKSPPATAARMLGVWLSADGSSNSTQALVHAEVTSVCSMLRHKSVTDVQAVYIVSNILILIILYRLTCTVLSANELKLLIGKYTSTIHQKFAMPASLPNSILFHHRLMVCMPSLMSKMKNESPQPSFDSMTKASLVK
ncbi:hypothetical protein BG005_003361 [Podila minutissima]|nr:hypothetical protein BG005_003361 [Podila minutissima]